MVRKLIDGPWCDVCLKVDGIYVQAYEWGVRLREPLSHTEYEDTHHEPALCGDHDEPMVQFKEWLGSLGFTVPVQAIESPTASPSLPALGNPFPPHIPPSEGSPVQTVLDAMERAVLNGHPEQPALPTGEEIIRAIEANQADKPEVRPAPKPKPKPRVLSWGELLEKRRVEIGYSVQEVAEYIGISLPAWQDWQDVNGDDRPTTEQASRISVSLELDPAEVYAALGYTPKGPEDGLTSKVTWNDGVIRLALFYYLSDIDHLSADRKGWPLTPDWAKSPAIHCTNCKWTGQGTRQRINDHLNKKIACQPGHLEYTSLPPELPVQRCVTCETPFSHVIGLLYHARNATVTSDPLHKVFETGKQTAHLKALRETLQSHLDRLASSFGATK